LLTDEAQLVIERENNRIATEAVMLKSAAAAVLSGEEGNRLFDELVTSLQESS
jgi:hypothetical protein